ncbi:MAG: ribosome recycling factor [Chloroflexi bacterium]|nr:ribosome recycling factor [Chloroflexota bacterium]
MMEEILADASSRMHKVGDVVKRELATIRTGHARPSLVENLRLDYHGTATPLYQLATITAPEARLLVIQPWDRHVLAEIEKAIQKSDLGLNPINDGKVIRLAIPQLNEERRRELVKLVKKRIEDGKVALRNVRRDAAEAMRELEREKKISTDEHKRAVEQLQRLTDNFIDELDQIGVDKEAEVMEV